MQYPYEGQGQYQNQTRDMQSWGGQGPSSSSFVNGKREGEAVGTSQEFFGSGGPPPYQQQQQRDQKEQRREEKK